MNSTEARRLPAARRLGLTLAVAMLATGSAARAEGPEQLYEGPPEARGWSLESNSQFGSGDERAHSVELFRGVGERLALGVEVEAEAGGGEFAVEELGVGALIGLSREDAPLQLAALVQVGVTTGGDLAQLEARLIGEHQRNAWRVLGNAIVRRVHADERGTSLGYAFAVDRQLGETFRLGVEASGQAASLGGFDHGFEPAHYAGPSAALALELGGEREVELGVKYLTRVSGGSEGGGMLRVVAGLEF